MPNNQTSLHQPLDAIVFDCDGTLSAMEGIDMLAEQSGVANEVKAMTAKAMGETGLTVEIYRDRLNLVKPTRNQVQELGQQYIDNLIPGALKLISILQSLNKAIYVVSAGLYPAISILGRHLNVPDKNIFAVGIAFNDQGEYEEFDQLSPLVVNHGKRDIIEHLKTMHQRIGYVGDGVNDMCVKDLVEIFIGFGGVYYRKNIKEFSDVYIEENSLEAVMPYLLCQDELGK